MPVDIQSLRNKSAVVPVDFFGITFHVSYDPVKVYDPEFRTNWRKRANDLNKEHQEYTNRRVRALQKRGKGEPVDDPEIEDEIDDPNAVSKRIWAGNAELMLMLVNEWDLTENGNPIPLESRVFLDGTLPPELADHISDKVWEDVRSLGNRNASANTN